MQLGKTEIGQLITDQSNGLVDIFGVKGLLVSYKTTFFDRFHQFFLVFSDVKFGRVDLGMFLRSILLESLIYLLISRKFELRGSDFGHVLGLLASVLLIVYNDHCIIKFVRNKDLNTNV